MSILDDLDNFFVKGDTFYPDNKKRAARIDDLNRDCNDFLALYKTEAENSRALMSGLNVYVGRLINDADLPEELRFTLPEQVMETPYESMMNIYSALCMNPMIQAAWQTARALIYSKSAEELGKDLAVTLGTAVTVQVGCMVFGSLAGCMIIGSVNGARRRSKLREAIREGVKCREEIYRRYYILTLIDRRLQTAVAALSAFESSGVSSHCVKEILVRKCDELKSEIEDEKEREKEIWDYLLRHDRINGSWTKEG